MASQTGAGSFIGLSATLPTTYDASGYGAVVTTEVGEVTEIGGDIGRVYSKVETKLLKTRSVNKRKGSYDPGTLTISCNRDDLDAGQILLNTAAKSDANYSFKLTRQDGSKKFFIGQVFSNPETIGDTDTMNTRTYAIEVNASPAGVDFVEVAPA